MNAHLISLRIAAALAAFATLGQLSLRAEEKPPLKTADLQVTIDVPPTWRPFLDDDIADALTSRLIDTFQKRGYTGRIEQLRQGDTAAKGVPQLEVRLIEWRIGRSGNADCTLSANVRTAAGEKDLGLITSSAIFWPHASGHWGLNRSYETANALEDAAESAMRDLYARLAKSALVPGLAPKK
jgi:hypothetical protein